MMIKLYDKNENEFDLKSLGLIGLKLQIPSPTYARETETMEGMGGEIEIERRLEPRPLNAEFWCKARDYEASLFARDELYHLIGSGETFYVSESRQPGKRWKVSASGWTPDRVNHYITSFTVPLTAHSGTAETLRGNRQTFSVASSLFKNEGSAKINMREQAETEITFRGRSQNLTIRNKTTGEEWKYNGSSTENDTILLKGVRSFKNGNSIFGQTNKKLIGFAPGWNEIEILGATDDFELEISTRFYFL